MDQLLATQFAQYVQAGDKPQAMRLLVTVLRRNPQDEQAWLAMAQITEGERQQDCVKRVLAISPNNPHALCLLKAPPAPRPTAKPAPPLPASPATGPSFGVGPSAPPPMPTPSSSGLRKKWPAGLYLLLGLGGGGCLTLCLLAVILGAVQRTAIVSAVPQLALFPSATPLPTYTLAATATLYPTYTALPTASVTPTPTPAPTQAATAPASASTKTVPVVDVEYFPARPQSLPDLAPLSPANVHDIAEWARLGRGAVTTVAYSPDGKWLAVGTTVGIFVFNSQTLAEERFIDTHDRVQQVAFSPNQNLLAWRTAGCSVALWDMAVDNIQTIHTPTPDDWADVWLASGGLAFSADGQTLAFVFKTRNLILWDVANGKSKGGFTSGTGVLGWAGMFDSAVRSVALSPDGQTVAWASAQDVVEMWNIASQGRVHALAGLKGYATTVAFSPDGRTVASSSGISVILWDAATGQALFQLNGHTDLIQHLFYSPDGNVLVSATDNDTMLWDVGRRQFLRMYRGRQAAAFSPDGQVLALISPVGVEFWRMSGAPDSHRLSGHLAFAQGLAISPGGEQLIVKDSSANLALWNIPEGKTQIWGTGTVQSATVSANGQWLAGVAEGGVGVWSLANGQALAAPAAPGQPVTALALSPDGQQLAWISAGGEIVIWDLPGGQALQTMAAPEPQSSLVFSPEGSLLVTVARFSPSATLWDVHSGQAVRTLKGEGPFWATAAFSPDGKYLALIDGHFIRLFDVGTGREVRTFTETAPTADTVFSPIRSLALSPGGTLLAAGSSISHTINLWEVGSGQLLGSLSGHTNWVTSLLFSADGKRLVSSALDGTVRLWGVAQTLSTTAQLPQETPWPTAAPLPERTPVLPPTSTPTATPDPKVLNIGFITSLTGSDEQNGPATALALQDEVDRINAAGGLGGYKLKLVVYDTQAQVAEAVSVTQRLMDQDKVVAIVGPNTSALALPIADIADAHKVPVVATTASEVNVTVSEAGGLHPYMFRVGFIDPYQGYAQADFAYNKLGKRKAALLTDVASPYTVGIHGFFDRRFIELGGLVVDKEGYNGGDAEFRAQLAKIKDSGADLLVVDAPTYKDVGLIAQQADAVGLKITLFAANSAYVPGLLQVDAPPLEGAYVTTGPSEIMPAFAQFNAEFAKKHPGMKANRYTYSGLDALLAIEHGINQAVRNGGQPTTTAIRDALEHMTDVQLFTSKITMEPDTHNPHNQPLEIMRIHNRQWEFVETYQPK